MQYPTIHMAGRPQDWAERETNTWMAMTWALLAFIGGAMVGMMAGKKGLRMTGGTGRAEGGSGMPMWKHHHHGFGQPSCHMKHETGMRGQAAPGAGGAQEKERDEGE